MTNKLIILAIAIVAVGLVALPETLALFAGQHNWYGVDSTNATDMGVPCDKCHADVLTQMTGSVATKGAHTGEGSGTLVTCYECHITSQTDTSAGGKSDPLLGGTPITVGGTGNIHAAAAPACMDCHGDNSVVAGTYSYGTAPPATSIYNGSNEAHKDFVNSAQDVAVTGSTLMEGSNEACVACHTHVSVEITWNKPSTINFTAASDLNGVWTVGNFVSKGPVEVTKVP